MLRLRRSKSTPTSPSSETEPPFETDDAKELVVDAPPTGKSLWGNLGNKLLSKFEAIMPNNVEMYRLATFSLVMLSLFMKADAADPGHDDTYNVGCINDNQHIFSGLLALCNIDQSTFSPLSSSDVLDRLDETLQQNDPTISCHFNSQVNCSSNFFHATNTTNCNSDQLINIGYNSPANLTAPMFNATQAVKSAFDFLCDVERPRLNITLGFYAVLTVLTVALLLCSTLACTVYVGTSMYRDDRKRAQDIAATNQAHEEAMAEHDDDSSVAGEDIEFLEQRDHIFAA